MSTPKQSTPTQSVHEAPPPATNGEDGDAEDTHETSPADQQGGYPEQKHAGAVGLGPEYGRMREPTATDKISGLKEVLVGKVTKNQDKIQHGTERRTGELKRKQMEQGDKADPFKNADGDDKKQNADDKKDTDEDKMDTSADKPDAAANNNNQATPVADSASSSSNANIPATSVTGKQGKGAHPSDEGAHEQAATTAPEGTATAERQRDGGNVETDRQIDEGDGDAANKKPRAE